MKKIILLYTFFAFTSIAVNAQEPTTEQKKTIFKNVDKLLKNYLEYSKFDDNDAYKKYANLFSNLSIKTIDEMNPEFYYTVNSEHPDTNLLHSITDILEKNKTNYPNGFSSVKLLASDVSYKQLNTSVVKLYIEKVTKGTNASKLTFTSTSTQVLEIKINSNDNFSATIQNLSVIATKLQFTQDNVNQKNEYVVAVKDAADKREAKKLAYLARIKFVEDSTKKAVEALAKYIADSIDRRLKDSIRVYNRISKVTELMNEPAHLWLSGGLLFGSSSSTLTQSDFMNNYAEHKNSTNGDVKFKYLHFVGGQIMLHRYFGKSEDKPNWGVGIGLSVASYTGSLQKDAFVVHYKANDQWGGEYRQIITAVGGINEQVKINNLSIPILVSVKNKIKGKLGYNIQAGIVYHLSFGDAITKTNATFNREAIYSFTGDTKNPKAEYDGGVTSEKSWLITKEQATKNGGSLQAAENYFRDMQGYGYNVGLNETPTNVSKSFKYSSGAIGFVLNPSITYEIQKPNANPMLLTFGIHCETTSFKNTKTDYKLIDEKLNYNSLMNSFSTVSVQSIGAYLGLSIPLNYNKSKWNTELTNLENQRKKYQNGN